MWKKRGEATKFQGQDKTRHLKKKDSKAVKKMMTVSNRMGVPRVSVWYLVYEGGLWLWGLEGYFSKDREASNAARLVVPVLPLWAVWLGSV